MSYTVHQYRPHNRPWAEHSFLGYTTCVHRCQRCRQLGEGA